MSFRVTNRATGSMFDVADGETVLEAARRQGINLAHSCLSGQCVACKAPVIAGDLHYPRLQPTGLSTADREAGMALLCQAVPNSDLTIVAREIEALRHIVTRQLTVELANVSFPVDDVALLRWRLPGREQLGYLAGQHLDVILPDGRRRSFSIANAPHAGKGLEMHVRHVEGGGFTDQVFGDLKPGDSLQIEAPLGTFFLRDRSPRPMICVAGGTGFSPIKAIVEEALLLGDERPLHVYWGARSEAELYLQDLPRRWAREHEHIAFVPVLSGETDSGWDGRTGFVHEAVLSDFNNLKPFDVYMSGPPPMIDGARREFIAHGLPEHHLYYDSFEFAPDILAKMRPTDAG